MHHNCAVITYNNQFNGNLSYAVVYAPQTPIGYLESPACGNAKVIWTPTERYYFTFPFSSSLRNGYMVVDAAAMNEARQKMIDTYGKIIFAFSYTELDFLHQTDGTNSMRYPSAICQRMSLMAPKG